jgi:antitoxin component YwqK of YwqJK toxin-antitoxin module
MKNNMVITLTFLFIICGCKVDEYKKFRDPNLVYKNIVVMHFNDDLNKPIMRVIYCTEEENDTKNATVKEFFPKGEIHSVYSILDGLLNGKIQQYNLDGTLRLTGYYSNGKKDGIWTYFDKEGNVSLIQKYKDDILIED